MKNSYQIYDGICVYIQTRTYVHTPRCKILPPSPQKTPPSCVFLASNVDFLCFLHSVIRSRGVLVLDNTSESCLGFLYLLLRKELSQSCLKLNAIDL